MAALARDLGISRRYLALRPPPTQKHGLGTRNMLGKSELLSPRGLGKHAHVNVQAAKTSHNGPNDPNTSVRYEYLLPYTLIYFCGMQPSPLKDSSLGLPATCCQSTSMPRPPTSTVKPSTPLMPPPVVKQRPR